jgi:hypothetical protein
MTAPEETGAGAPPDDEAVPIPIEWYVPEGIVSRYANNFVIQQNEHEFILTVFESVPPILLGPPDEVRAKAEEIKSIRATAIARIVLAPGRLAELNGILESALETYRARLDREEHHE